MKTIILLFLFCFLYGCSGCEFDNNVPQVQVWHEDRKTGEMTYTLRPQKEFEKSVIETKKRLKSAGLYGTDEQ